MSKRFKTAAQLAAASVAIVFLFVFVNATEPKKPSTTASSSSSAVSTAPKVTFIELGSVNCVPCKMMQTVMKNIESKYPKDVKVVFYDVWTSAGEPFGKKYGIRAIPTQVFLDASGKEFSRHEGFFPQEELEKVLKTKGVTQ